MHNQVQDEEVGKHTVFCSLHIRSTFQVISV